MPDIPAASGVIESLVRTCRARIASQQTRRDGFLAVAVALLGICALLLMGTRYVPFATLPLIAVLGAWLAIRHWRLTIPDDYAVAQRIDQKEGLSDQLATAFHFRTVGRAHSPQVAESQYERATEVAAGVAPEAVFPRTAPATQRHAALLLATAVLFLGLRAGLQPTLSFEPPLATLLLSSLFGLESQPPVNQRAAAQIDRPSPEGPTEDGEKLAGRPDAEAESSDSPLPEESFQPPDATDEMPDVDGLVTVPLDEMLAEGLEEDSSLEAGELDDGLLPDDTAGDAPPDPGEDPWSEEAQSLLDKLKQAFENMLQTLDLASVESADSEQGQEQGSGSAEESASQGDPADTGEAGQEMSSELADASMEGGQPGEEAGETASAGNTSGEDSSGLDSSGENVSAAGTSDGSKEFAAAEQLEVLGGLEDLYMERAENMSGEVTIETRLAEQSASVPYNERSTMHADQGGAISRDEIPVQYRTYIQNYFQALRRNSE